MKFDPVVVGWPNCLRIIVATTLFTKMQINFRTVCNNNPYRFPHSIDWFLKSTPNIAFPLWSFHCSPPLVPHWNLLHCYLIWTWKPTDTLLLETLQYVNGTQSDLFDHSWPSIVLTMYTDRSSFIEDGTSDIWKRHYGNPLSWARLWPIGQN